jgi:hypothetical protein
MTTRLQEQYLAMFGIQPSIPFSKELILDSF